MRRVRLPVGVVLAGLLALLGSSAEPVAAQPRDPILSEIRADWESRQQAVRSLRVRWTLRETTPKGAISLQFPPPLTPAGVPAPPADAVNEGSGAMSLEGNRARISREAMVWHTTKKKFHKDRTESVIEGTEYKCLLHYGSQNWPKGVLSVKNGWHQEAEITIWPLLLAVRGCAENITTGSGVNTYSSARRTTLDGRAVVEMTRQRNETTGEGKVWLDPAQHHFPSRVDEYQRNDDLAYRIVVTSVRRVQEVAVPAAWTITRYRDRVMVSHVSVSLTTVEVNPALPPEEFCLDFPVGTYVVDTTKQEPQEYITRDGGAKRVVLPEERPAGYERLVTTESGELSPGGPAHRPSNRLAGTLIGSVLLVVATAAVFMIRKRRRLGPGGRAPGSHQSRAEGV